MNKIKLAIIGIVAILLVIIIFQNLEEVSTHLLFVTVEMPMAALLFITALAGFFIGFFARFTFLKGK